MRDAARTTCALTISAAFVLIYALGAARLSFLSEFPQRSNSVSFRSCSAMR